MEFKAHSGCNMLELGFIPNCAIVGGKGLPFNGCASYVYTKLKKTLDIGKVYEVSMWVNFMSVFALPDPNAHKYVGMMLSNGVLHNDGYYAMIKNTTFLADTLPVGQWKKLTWRVQPTCELNYLTIGFFRGDSLPVQEKEKEVHGSSFLLDDVSIVELNGVASDVLPTMYCKEKAYEPDNENFYDIDFQDILFDSKSAEIRPSEFQKLDSVLNAMKRFPELCVDISGHTDDLGTQNEELSKSRAEAVLRYFTNSRKVSKTRFLLGHYADKMRVKDNTTEEGRAKNRRVALAPLKISKCNLCYRYAIEFAKNNKLDSCFMMLNCWESGELDRYKILVYSDERLANVRRDKRWKALDQRIRKTYGRQKQPSQAFFLDSMYCVDQKYRTIESYLNDLGGYVKNLDTVDYSFPKISGKEWIRQDSLNTLVMLNFLKKNEFPLESQVGERPARALPLILIHRQDTILLTKYLPIYDSKCRMGEGDWSLYAMMYDKWCVLRKVPQRYATQYYSLPEKLDKYYLYPSIPLEEVNKYRKLYGLPEKKELEYK